MFLSITHPMFLHMVQKERENGSRPSIEAIPVISRGRNHWWLCSFESGRRDTRLDKRTHKFKFPGGGIKKHETPLEALLRELEEEIGVKVQLSPFESLPVLASGVLPTSRPNWGGKMRIITYVIVPDNPFVLNGELIKPRRFATPNQLLEQVDCCTNTRPEVAALYKKAISALPNVFW